MVEVLDISPWSFDKRIILLLHFNGDLSSSNVTFQRSPFWIRVSTFLLKVRIKLLIFILPMRLVLLFWLKLQRVVLLGALSFVFE